MCYVCIGITERTITRVWQEASFGSAVFSSPAKWADGVYHEVITRKMFQLYEAKEHMTVKKLLVTNLRVTVGKPCSILWCTVQVTLWEDSLFAGKRTSLLWWREWSIWLCQIRCSCRHLQTINESRKLAFSLSPNIKRYNKAFNFGIMYIYSVWLLFLTFCALALLRVFL